MPSDRFVFAHLADAHVGAWPRDPAVRTALRESVLRALRVVSERDAQFLLVSGDLFHTPVPDPAEVAPIAAALRALVDEGRRIYVIYGSHDYVAHRTSWLDVLAETGVFLKVAPEAVRSEGTRWTLPFHVDEPTGARIAGISGRSHGLDREYFRAVDSEAFRAAPGFKIFQFHAAISEYLPEHLRGHIPGVSRSDLPGGCDYYAGGHIHYTYEGEGPDGGLLVNPGAVFGTSTTDLEHAMRGRTKQGVVIVEVHDGRVATARWIETAPKDRMRVVDIDVTGQSAEEARASVRSQVEAAAAPGTLLFPRISGTLTDGSAASLGLVESATDATSRGAAGVHWEVDGLESGTGPEAEAELETAALSDLSADTGSAPPGLRGAEGLARLRELLKELGTPRGEGE